MRNRRIENRPANLPDPGEPQNKFAGRLGARLDKNPGWFSYVNVIYIHNGAHCRDGEGNGLHRRCQSMARPRSKALPPPYVRYAMAPRLDCRHRAGFPDLVANWPCPSLFHTREQKNGLLEPRALGEQDGTDAVQDGADAQLHGPRWIPVRSVLERQPRLRRISYGDAAAARGRAEGISRIPRPVAPRQGQGRVRPVYGAASLAADPPVRRSAPALRQGLASGVVPQRS